MSVNFPEIKASLEDLGDKYEKFQRVYEKKHDELKAGSEALRERLEDLESRGKSPGKTGAGKDAPIEHKVFHTAQGPVYELPSHVKMADVIKSAKPPEISFQRWLPAALLGEKCGDKEAVEYAREMKQMTTGTSGVVIPGEYQSQWIDMLRAQMVLNAAGMRTVTMDQKTLTAAAIVSDPTASWHTEAGSISAVDPTFSERKLTAQTLVTRCQGSVELAQDSPNFGEQLAAAMAKSMAAALDRAGLIGSGTPPEPQGILGASGVGQVTSIGALTDYSKLIEAVQTLLVANVPLDVATANAIMPPGVWAKLENLATGITSDKTQLPRPRSLENTRFLVTSSIPTASPPTSTAFMGDFRDLVLGMRADASVEALKLTTYASNLLIEYVGYLRADFMIARPASFVTLEGINV